MINKLRLAVTISIATKTVNKIAFAGICRLKSTKLWISMATIPDIVPKIIPLLKLLLVIKKVLNPAHEALSTDQRIIPKANIPISDANWR